MGSQCSFSRRVVEWWWRSAKGISLAAKFRNCWKCWMTELGVGSNKSLGCIFNEKPADWTNAFKFEISCWADFYDVLLHGQVWVKNDSNVLLSTLQYWWGCMSQRFGVAFTFSGHSIYHPYRVSVSSNINKLELKGTSLLRTRFILKVEEFQTHALQRHPHTQAEQKLLLDTTWNGQQRQKILDGMKTAARNGKHGRS